MRNSIVRVYYRPGAPGAAMLDAAADAFDPIERGSAPIRIGRSGSPSRPALRDGITGTHLDPDRVRASNLRYLAAHETAHQWFYGSSATTRRRSPSPTRPPPTSSRARARPAARQPMRQGDARPDDLFAYSRPATTRRSTSRAEPDRRRAQADGLDRFWAALRGYVSANAGRISTTPAAPPDARRRDAARSWGDAVRAALPDDLLSASVEAELFLATREDDRHDAGSAARHGHREVVLAQPGREAGGVHAQRQSPQPDVAARMRDGGRPGQMHSVAPPDEERQTRLDCRDIETRAAPAEDVAAGVARDPSVIDAPRRPATSSMASVRTAQPSGAPGAAAATQRPKALRVATSGSTTAISSRYASPSGMIRFAVPHPG